jgi:hypothetical protein
MFLKQVSFGTSPDEFLVKSLHINNLIKNTIDKIKETLAVLGQPVFLASYLKTRVRKVVMRL